MKLLRFLLVLAVIGYAGWLAWPFVSPFLEGAPVDIAATRAGAESGLTSGFGPTALLWIAAVVLYLLAALMLGSGNPRAAAAYFMGFIADAALRLAIDRGRGGGAAPEISARSAEVTAAAAPGLDPTWLILGALLVVGVLVLVASRRVRRRREPGHLAA
jgi:hypothetical protein